jgi:hypothetical protein
MPPPPISEYTVGLGLLELAELPIPPTLDPHDGLDKAKSHAQKLRRASVAAGDEYGVGRPRSPSKLAAPPLPKHRSLALPNRRFSTGEGSYVSKSPFLRQMLSGRRGHISVDEMQLESFKEFDSKQADFFRFLDKELDKIEKFYRLKEAEATGRLDILKRQLHEMGDRRIEEMKAAQSKRERVFREQERHLQAYVNDQSAAALDHIDGGGWTDPIVHTIGIGAHRLRGSSRALVETGPLGPVKPKPWEARYDSWRDFTRRPTPANISYPAAKKKLKVALQEFYRGLELLKAYASLNRTAFRKINKKYDKAVQARPTGRYMSEKVNKANFVQSEVVDNFTVAVEDLYARYFERGNHKMATRKLRSKHPRSDAYTGSVFRNGLLLAAGAVLAVQGVTYGAEHLSSPDPTIRLNTAYLLEVSFPSLDSLCLLTVMHSCMPAAFSRSSCSCFSASIA